MSSIWTTHACREMWPFLPNSRALLFTKAPTRDQATRGRGFPSRQTKEKSFIHSWFLVPHPFGSAVLQYYTKWQLLSIARDVTYIKFSIFFHDNPGQSAYSGQ